MLLKVQILSSLVLIKEIIRNDATNFILTSNPSVRTNGYSAYYTTFSVGCVHRQQCPIQYQVFLFSSYKVFVNTLNVTLCLKCGFGRAGYPSDTVWSLNGNTLINGSMNGEVLIDSNNTIILLNPANVLKVNDTLTCTSASAPGEYNITIVEFSESISIYHNLSHDLLLYSLYKSYTIS